MGFFEKLFRKKSPTDQSPVGGERISFKVGDRVRNPWGGVGTVTSVDPSAEHGLGKLTVKMDDGSEKSVALVAPGFEVVADGG